MAHDLPSQDAQEPAASNEYGVNFAVAGGYGGVIHTPVHESITLAALISTGYNVAPGTTLESASNADWEYIRGVVWNDDPACLLFDDYAEQNHTYSSAVKWGWYYTAGESEWEGDKSDKMQNPTGRSHYGDLQFLHCMASKSGENPAETKEKLMKWLSVLWKLANGEQGITPDTVISKTDLSAFCPNFSLPANWGTLRYLLSNESSFEALDIPRRALGSMFHIIQDSYSLGHTRRTLLNPEAKISHNPLKFQPGVADKWGPIENFHVYNGQDDGQHEKYDHANVSIPDPGNLANLDQFNGLIGCRDAVEKCRGLVELKKEGKTWDTGVRKYLDEVVFALSKDATGANTQVGTLLISTGSVEYPVHLSLSCTFDAQRGVIMASITVNGNTIEEVESEEVDSAPNAKKSNFILVQVDRVLSLIEKEVLANHHVEIQEYVAENTFLCRYEPEDLQVLRLLPFVVTADVYLPQLKTTISLKEMVESEQDQEYYEVDLILHENPNLPPEQLAPLVAQAAGLSLGDLEILPRKIRATIHQDKLAALAKLDSVNRIEEVRQYVTYNDQARAILLDAGAIQDASVPYQGTGQVICVADTGFDQGIPADTEDIKVHPAFLHRVVKVMGMVPDTSTPNDPVGHGTHVCASICGNGVYKNTNDMIDVPIKGTAPNAKIIVQAMSQWHKAYRAWILKPPSDTSTLYSAAYEHDARIHNNSWGLIWSPTARQLGYEDGATAIDRFMCDKLDFCILVAAGNDAMATNAGASQIGDNGAAKNCITVGATGTTRDNDGQRYTRGFKHGSDITSVAMFSSHGPTLPARNAQGGLTVGRIKPDVVAPGVAILSAASRALPPKDHRRVANGTSADPDWMFQSGTSQATPLVSGCAALLREALQTVGKNNISAALIKALLVNGAVLQSSGKGGGKAPIYDYAQGFGRVNVSASLRMVQQLSFVDGWKGNTKCESNRPHAQDVPLLRVTSDADRTWQSPPLAIPAGGARTRLTVTMTYPDPCGALLQNDMNLIVRAGPGGAVERHGNMAEGDQEFDAENNVEKIIWDDVPGPTAVIIVKAQAFSITSVDQTFAVAWDLQSL
ncbi:subtilisin-like protein [Pyrenochaeta sp. DS3sAY3a]|nr:subtilisin-like protein [Pyrenochaeta sp. DS3sAY3a]